MKSPLSGLKTFFMICTMLFVVSYYTHGQTIRKNDVIVTKDKEKIEAIIQEVDASTIKYKKVSDPDGPLFTINKTEVSSIHYGNGEVEKLDKSTDEYFAPGNDVPPVIKRPERTYYNSGNSLSARDSEQLRSNFKLYAKKANFYRNMGLIGISTGVLLTVVGIVKISQWNNTYNGYGSYGSDDDLTLGAALVTTGLGAGIPLTIIGFVKSKKYTRRAIDVKNELRRRNQPLSMRLSPGFNPKTNAGYLSLKVEF